MVDKIKKAIMWLLLVIEVALVLLPLLPYKRASEISNSTYLNNNDYIQLKVTALSSGEMKINDEGTKKLEQFAVDSKYIPSNKIIIIGNTPYENLTTFKYGISQHLNFVVLGTFTKEINSKGYLIFNVEEWYPEDEYIPLIDTYFWENNIETPYSIALIPTLTLVIIQMFYIFKIAIFSFKEI